MGFSIGFKVSSPRGVNFSNIGTSSRLASTHQFNSLIRGNIPDISEFENFNSNTVHSKHSSNGDRTSLVKIPSRNTSSDDSQNNFSTNISRSPLLVKRNPTLTAFDGIDVHDLPLLKPATSAEPSPISGGSPSIPKQQSKNALLGEKLQQRTPSVIRLDGTGKKGPQHIHSPSLPSRLTTPSFQNHPDPTVVAIHEQMMGSLMPLDDMVQPVVKHMLKDGIYGFKEDVPDSMEARLQVITNCARARV